MDYFQVIRKRDAVLCGNEVGTVIEIYTKGYLNNMQISKKDRVLKIQLANGEKKLIWETNATKLDKSKFKKK